MSKHAESIGRRAREYAEVICPNNEMGQIVRSTAYTVGALEERKELIEKACEWLEDKLRMYAGYSDTADLVDSFRKAMEE